MNGDDMVSEGAPSTSSLINQRAEAWERQRLRLERAMNDANVRATNLEEYADNLYKQANSARLAADDAASQWFEAKERLDRWETMKP